MRFEQTYRHTFAAAACLSVLSVAAHAETLRLGAMLSGATEVPANTITGTGRVMAKLEVTAAHFHGQAAVGANAKPVVPVGGPYDATSRALYADT